MSLSFIVRVQVHRSDRLILRHCRTVAASDREVARSTEDAKRRVASLTELANDGGCSMFKYIKLHFTLR